MESCVEYYNVWNVSTENFFCRTQTDSVSFVMSWSQNGQVVDDLDNFIVNKAWFAEFFSTLNDTVADSVDFGFVFDNFALAYCHHINNFSKCFFMCWECCFYFPFAAVCFMCDE